eukprot:3504645-Pyramimonas_sp.AAC.1
MTDTPVASHGIYLDHVVNLQTGRGRLSIDAPPVCKPPKRRQGKAAADSKAGADSKQKAINKRLRHNEEVGRPSANAERQRTFSANPREAVKHAQAVKRKAAT